MDSSSSYADEEPLSTQPFIYRILVSGKLSTRPFIYHISVSGKLSILILIMTINTIYSICKNENNISFYLN